MSTSISGCVTMAGNYSDDVYTITLPTDSYSTYSSNTITITGASGTSFGGAGSSWSTANIPDTIFNWTETVPFEDGFPEWNEFQEMCKAYPGLEKTYEHLKCFYKMCNDDWQAKKKDIE